MKNETERIRAAFERPMSVPQTLNDKLERAYETIREDEMNKKTIHRSGRTILLIAAVMLALTATALAIGIHNDFFHSAYGNAVDSLKPYTVTILNEDGSIAFIESYFGFNRAEIDPETAERLLGEYVTPVNQAIDIAGYTFTVRDVALDENYIGALTVDITNPNGHGIKLQGGYTGQEGDYCPYSLDVESDGQMLDCDYVVASENYSETFARVIVYITPFAEADVTKDLTLKIWVFPSAEADAIGGRMEIAPAEHVPAKHFVAEGIDAGISPLGIRLIYAGEKEFVQQKMVIHYADGTELVCEDDESMILNLACMSGMMNDHYAAFNTIVDVDAIESVEILYNTVNPTKVFLKPVK